MNFIKWQNQIDFDPYNYYAIAILENLGNSSPTEEEIILMERQLNITYPKPEHFWRAVQSLTLRELIIDVV